jgi:glycosyltransferase involved in cell wall biosynthesis
VRPLDELSKVGLVLVCQQRDRFIPEGRFEMNAQGAVGPERAIIQPERNHEAQADRGAEVVGQAADPAARARFHQAQDARDLELLAQLAGADADLRADFIERRQPLARLATVRQQVAVAVCQEGYMQALAMGVSTDRVTLIYNGVDLDVFRPSERARSAFRSSLGIAPETPLVGFVGRIDAEKGPDQFLQAAQVIHAEVPNAHFVLVGAGHQYDRMQQMTADLGLSEVTHFAGLWPDTAKVYPAIDLLLQTSRIEGTPLSLLEAMACELPVVALGVGGVPEIVEEARTGMLVSPGDWRGVGTRAIELLEHPARMAAMGQAARARARSHFDLRATVAQTTRLMETLVQRGVAGRSAAALTTQAPLSRARRTTG